MAEKLTQAQRRVLERLVKLGGAADDYDLAYPRAPLLHRLYMAKLITADGNIGFGGHLLDGKWRVTDAGRTALANL